ncbi:MAG: hypothetical protein NZ924_04170 [Candidatus Bipolaricaulota bacterium]|nr:hypothetical protein [Candidatus Bipolaricaulota bacterium]MDW8152096.1 hypothetical protein [Candidatus Bipolaricaulota bacterium]
MYRGFLVAGIWALVLALGALFWLGWQALHRGLPLQLESPVRVEVAHPLALTAPLEVRVVALPLTLPARFGVAVEGPVRAETELLRCPRCREGGVLPVRWSLLTGAVVWRCGACGAEVGP